MDERTRKTDEDLAPNLRRTAPEPDVKPRSRTRLRIGLGLVAVLLALAAFQIVRWVKSAPPPGGRFPQGTVQTVGASTAALGDVRVILNEIGTVTPLATVTVQTQINGQLT